MTGPEFTIVLAWVLFPPCFLAFVALAVDHRRSRKANLRSTLVGGVLLVVTSIALSMAFVVASPPSLGRFLAMRDTPFLWAPFAFLAVAISFPVALWWARRGARP